MGVSQKLLDMFKGKVVSFSSADETLAIKNIAIENLEGRLFIVGQIPNGATKNDWAANCECAIAWDVITDYILFESEEQYVELMAKNEVD